MPILIVGWFLLAILAMYVAVQRRRPVFEGFVLGLVFGPLGVLVAALLPMPPAPARPHPAPQGPRPKARAKGSGSNALGVAIILAMLGGAGLLVAAVLSMPRAG